MTGAITKSKRTPIIMMRLLSDGAAPIPKLMDPDEFKKLRKETFLTTAGSAGKVLLTGGVVGAALFGVSKLTNYRTHEEANLDAITSCGSVDMQETLQELKTLCPIPRQKYLRKATDAIAKVTSLYVIATAKHITNHSLEPKALRRKRKAQSAIRKFLCKSGMIMKLGGSVRPSDKEKLKGLLPLRLDARALVESLDKHLDQVVMNIISAVDDAQTRDEFTQIDLPELPPYDALDDCVRTSEEIVADDLWCERMRMAYDDELEESESESED